MTLLMGRSLTTTAKAIATIARTTTSGNMLAKPPIKNPTRRSHQATAGGLTHRAATRFARRPAPRGRTYVESDRLNLGVEPSIGRQKQNQVEIQDGCVPNRRCRLYQLSISGSNSVVISQQKSVPTKHSFCLRIDQPE